jgi:hypothetical protein
VPRPLLLETGSELDPRPPAERLSRRPDVGPRERRVAVRGRIGDDPHRATRDPLDGGDHLVERRRLPAPDIEHGPPQGRSGIEPGSDRGRHHIGDVGELPPLLTVAPAAEGRGVFAGCHEEAMDGHVGTLSGPEDGEVAERDDVETPLAVDGGQLLPGGLRDTVRADGRHVAVTGARPVPVDRRARRVDNAIDPGAGRCFQHALGDQDVEPAAVLEAGAPRVLHPWPAGQVEHHIAGRQQPGEVALGQVGAEQREARLAESPGQVPALGDRVVPRLEVVDPDHLDPPTEEPVDQVRPDEAGGSCNHRPPLPHRPAPAARPPLALSKVVTCH